MRPQWDADDLRHIASGSLKFTAVQAKAIRAKVSTCCTATGRVGAVTFRLEEGSPY
jgi:hypothetical protein